MIFVPESLILQKHTVGPVEVKESFREAGNQFWTDRAKNFNFIKILTSRTDSDPKTRRNLIALASINTIMFGAFMGAMNVMLLYSEVSGTLCMLDHHFSEFDQTLTGTVRLWLG